MRTISRAIITKDDAILVMHRNKFGQEFYSLVGGGIDEGETAEQAVLREVMEESSLTVANPRLVATQSPFKDFGPQYIYVCDYVSGEPRLLPDSEEATSNSEGDNRYEPIWLAIDELSDINLLPAELKPFIIESLKNGFPSKPILLTINA